MGTPGCTLDFLLQGCDWRRGMDELHLYWTNLTDSLNTLYSTLGPLGFSEPASLG